MEEKRALWNARASGQVTDEPADRRAYRTLIATISRPSRCPAAVPRSLPLSGRRPILGTLSSSSHNPGPLHGDMMRSILCTVCSMSFFAAKRSKEGCAFREATSSDVAREADKLPASTARECSGSKTERSER
ncbi:hypothetical protein MRX96_003817 [Rhipicephalus microplus]